MGQVITTLTVINRLDEGLAERGVLAADQVRQVTLNDVLVDTGATGLCLPANTIAELGLAPLKEVLASTAAGDKRVRIFQDAKISLMGRAGVFQCLELPGGERPLLGAIPMEDLGVEIDLQKRELRLLPEGPDRTHIMAYGHLLYHLDGTTLDELERQGGMKDK